MRVARSNEFLFEVDDDGKHCRVCLQTSKCSCNEWKIANFPCPHVVAAILSNDYPIYLYIDSSWSINQFQQQYSYAIQPIPNEDLPQFIDEENDLEPPEASVAPGRPRVNRVPSIGERTTRLILCNNCNTLGHHNRRTCPHPSN
ncbi:Zinc finger protein [Thalictrum thalictroides]|uniref:Zinc finger protein n=1 Tax=Thalictrum thalictroides TaxID=46969 RepID=A0A7J6VHC9_THATH|nr:Zinc finger protein [Thalictrum thalictroides]